MAHSFIYNPQVLLSPFRQKCLWVVFLGVVFFCLHKAAQVAPPLSHLLIKEAHKGEVSLLEGDGGGSWQAAGVREPGR